MCGIIQGLYDLFSQLKDAPFDAFRSVSSIKCRGGGSVDERTLALGTRAFTDGLRYGS